MLSSRSGSRGTRGPAALRVGALFAWIALLSSVALAAPRTRYVLIFIGDGMGPTHVRAAELYKQATEGKAARLRMTQLPVRGPVATQCAGGKTTDSAAAATALATGFTTSYRALGMNADHTQTLTTVAEQAKARGMRVGVVTTVTLNHATPAGFYAHVKSRSEYRVISMAFLKSGIDYAAGAGFSRGRGDKGQPTILDFAPQHGYRVVRTREEFVALRAPVAKALVVNASRSGKPRIYFEMERPTNRLSLVEFTRKGIELLDGPDGFFMMVEGGLIDWASHANDAGAAIREVVAFDAAVAEGVRFYEGHARETLLIVTADHETGGMTLDPQTVADPSRLRVFRGQRLSYLAFNQKLNDMRKDRKGQALGLEDVMPAVRDAFGIAAKGSALTLTKEEAAALREALVATEKAKTEGGGRLRQYGGREPLTITITRILEKSAGVGWSTFSHTDTRVPVMAIGVGQGAFAGEQTSAELGRKLLASIGARPKAAPVGVGP